METQEVNHGSVSDLEVGGHVVYVDPLGRPRPALVTAIHGPAGPGTSINVAIVCNDPTMTDSYGRQLSRATSVCHQSRQSAHGYYWRAVDSLAPLNRLAEGTQR